MVSSLNLITQPFLITFWGQIPLLEPKECTRLDDTMIKFDFTMIIIACFLESHFRPTFENKDVFEQARFFETLKPEFKKGLQKRAYRSELFIRFSLVLEFGIFFIEIGLLLNKSFG